MLRLKNYYFYIKYKLNILESAEFVENTDDDNLRIFAKHEYMVIIIIIGLN